MFFLKYITCVFTVANAIMGFSGHNTEPWFTGMGWTLAAFWFFFSEIHPGSVEKPNAQ